MANHTQVDWLHQSVQFPVEQTIGMINTLVQHYGAGTTLAKKLSASIEALQLEIGCIGSPFDEKYDNLHLYYNFQIYLDYPSLPLPRKVEIVKELRKAHAKGLRGSAYARRSRSAGQTSSLNRRASCETGTTS
jgi:hypothetical protein